MLTTNTHNLSFERRAWELNQRVNERGIQLDMAYIATALQTIEEIEADLGERARAVTGGVDVSQRAAMLDWCQAQGYPLPDYTKGTVAAAATDKTAPAHVREVLRIRQQLGKTSTAKFVSMQACACSDGRVRGTTMYHGASTGRETGKLIQPQNFPRPHKSVEGIEDVLVDAILAGDRDAVGLYAGVDMMEALSSTLRSAIVAAPGHRLLVSDFDQIEARVTGWLGNQQSVLDVFASGEDIYKHAAAQIYTLPVSEIDGAQRQIGKVATLALGFQGGVGAFQQMAGTYGVTVADEVAEDIVRKWRKAHPHIVSTWKHFQTAALRAIENPGKAYRAAGRVIFKVENGFLFMKLPSGRRIAYCNPRIETVNRNDWVRPAIVYDGVDTYTKKWSRQETYGGDLFQSVVQGIARDLMIGGMLNVDAAGYPPVLAVHDEVVAEVPHGHGAIDQFNSLLCRLPDWAEGLPVTASGYEAARYRK